MKATFIGGPLHGQIKDVPDTQRQVEAQELHTPNTINFEGTGVLDVTPTHHAETITYNRVSVAGAVPSNFNHYFILDRYEQSYRGVFQALEAMALKQAPEYGSPNHQLQYLHDKCERLTKELAGSREEMRGWRSAALEANGKLEAENEAMWEWRKEALEATKKLARIQDALDDSEDDD